MLVQTTEMAIRALLVLTFEDGSAPVTPKQLAEKMGCSPSYLGKTLGTLVKAGILASVRGAHGGVLLRRRPAEVTLLEIIEACQGVILGDFCAGSAPGEAQCAYHVAMREVYDKTTEVLRRWTLADLKERPVRCRSSVSSTPCKMAFGGCEAIDGWCLNREVSVG
jgi:Rrf2 family protein